MAGFHRSPLSFLFVFSRSSHKFIKAWHFQSTDITGFISNFSSISSIVKASLLKRMMKEHKLSFSPYSILSRLDKQCLCLCPPIKLLTNNLFISLKEPTVFGGILLNHTRADPLRVVGKALHIISSGTP